MTTTVHDAADALAALSREDMLAAIERAVERHGQASDAAEITTLLRMTLARESQVEALTGAPSKVHTLVESAFVDLRIKVEARRAILSIDMLDSSAVADLLGASGRNKREAASDLRRRGTIVGVPVSGRKLVYPAFQFDPVDRMVIPVVAVVNARLGALEDPWGVASWWISPQPRLDGQAPRELIGSDRTEQLLTLAGVNG